jgi:hypothetical protein
MALNRQVLPVGHGNATRGRPGFRLLFAWLFTWLFIWTAAAASARADAVADFYQHKTITLIAGFPPGGGYDTYIRVLARHYGQFIPGNPTVTPANVPGAGSMTAANRIYKSEPSDGTVLGEFASSVVMEPLLATRPRCSTRCNSAGSAACRRTSPIAACGSPPAPRRRSTICCTRRRFSAAARRRRSRTSIR